MPRSVDEWRGRAPETPAPLRVKLRIIAAQGDVCGCGCGVPLGQGGEGIEFDHTIALVNGGENVESNLRALRAPCHADKTVMDVGLKSKIARVKAKHLGLWETKRKMPCGRKSPWKKRLDGTVVRRDD